MSSGKPLRLSDFMAVEPYRAPQERRSKHRNAKRTKGRKRFQQQWQQGQAASAARKRKKDGPYID